MYKEMRPTEEGRKWMEEFEARINDYLKEKIRTTHEEKTTRKGKKDKPMSTIEKKPKGMQRVLLGVCPIGRPPRQLPAEDSLTEEEQIPERITE